jgi:hypothetical protein
MTIILITVFATLCAAFLVAIGEGPISIKARICLISGMTLGACLLVVLAAPGGIIGGGLEGMLVLGTLGAIAGAILGGIYGTIVFALALVIDKVDALLTTKN